MTPAEIEEQYAFLCQVVRQELVRLSWSRTNLPGGSVGYVAALPERGLRVAVARSSARYEGMMVVATPSFVASRMRPDFAREVFEAAEAWERA